MSSTTFDIALDVASPETTALLVIFLRPPPDASMAINMSPLATVEISDNALTAVELNLEPSAINKLPEVFVPVVMSAPAIVMFPLPSSKTALLAGSVHITVLFPEEKLTALSLLELVRTVVRVRSELSPSNVPRPTSHSSALS